MMNTHLHWNRAIITALIMTLLLSCTFFSRVELGASDSEQVWPAMGSGMMRNGMGPGMMGRGMGPGMMDFSSIPPPQVTQIPTATPGGSETVSYRLDVQPIFNRSCVTCHSGSAGLWLDRYERVLIGSSNGPVIVPGDTEASELYQRITGRIQPVMPLGGVPLSAEEIDIIGTWITEGTPNN